MSEQWSNRPIGCVPIGDPIFIAGSEPCSSQAVSAGDCGRALEVGEASIPLQQEDALAGRANPKKPKVKPETLDAREKLLRAAAELLAEQPSGDVTTRDIAERAGLQHSLIHRHFGGKDGLVRAVVSRVQAGYYQAVATAGSPSDGFEHAFEYLVDNPVAAAAFVGAVTDENGTEPLNFPGVALHVTQLADGTKGGGRDPRIVAVAALALMGGWVGIEDLAMRAGALDDLGVVEVRRQIGEILTEMVIRESKLPRPRSSAESPSHSPKQSDAPKREARKTEKRKAPARAK